MKGLKRQQVKISAAENPDDRTELFAGKKQDLSGIRDENFGKLKSRETSVNVKLLKQMFRSCVS